MPGPEPGPEGQAKRPPEPWLAVNLSLFWPGFGQLYAGRAYGRGLAIAQLALTAMTIVLIVYPGAGILSAIGSCALTAFLSIGSLFDAHRAARSAQPAEAEPGRRREPDAWLAVFLSRILPGLGHLYLRKPVPGVLFLVGTLVVTGLEKRWPATLLISASWLGLCCYDAYRRSPAPREPDRSAIRLLAACVAALALFWGGLGAFLREGVIQAFRVSSQSMAPDLQNGDLLFVAKGPWKTPRRGDIVVFRYPPDPSKQFVKRVVGVPGDVLEMTDKTLILNGRPAAERYVVHRDPAVRPSGYDARDNFGPLRIGAAQYFVLGDNRDDSNDSRFFGPVRADRVDGRAFKIYWPPSRAGPVR